MAILKSATKEQVMGQLNSMDKNKTSIIADLKDVTDWDVSPGNFTVDLKGHPYHFRSWARSQLLRKLRIPKSYFGISSTELRDKELKEGFENLSRGSENRFKIYVNPETNEQEVYGFIPTKCHDVLSGEIMEQVLAGMGSQDGVLIDEFSSCLESMRIRFVNPTHSYIEVDEEFPGVDFAFSEVLKTPVLLQSVLYRKVCSNGLVVPQEMNQSFKMPLQRFKQDVFELQIQYVDNANSGLEAIARSIEALKAIQLPTALIDDADQRNLFDDVIEYVLPSRNLRGTYGQLIRAEYNNEGNLTVNGLVNATTKIARDLSEDDSKVSLESSAGMFVSRIAVSDERAQESGTKFEYTKENIDRIFKKMRKLGVPQEQTV